MSSYGTAYARHRPGMDGSQRGPAIMSPPSTACASSACVFLPNASSCRSAVVRLLHLMGSTRGQRGGSRGGTEQETSRAGGKDAQPTSTQEGSRRGGGGRGRQLRGHRRAGGPPPGERRARRCEGRVQSINGALRRGVMRAQVFSAMGLLHLHFTSGHPRPVHSLRVRRGADAGQSGGSGYRPWATDHSALGHGASPGRSVGQVSG